MARAGDPITGRVALLGNDDVTLARCRPEKPQQELFRNADADELIFVHSGRGTLHSLFGPLPFRELDYIVIPRCTTYRLEFEAGSQPDMLVIEGAGNISVPRRYLNPDGQLKLGSPYCERDLHGPRAINVIDRREGSLRAGPGSPTTDAVYAGEPSIRRGGLGWNGLPIHVQRRRFRADHRADPSASAGAPDLRRAGVRRVHVRPEDA